VSTKHAGIIDACTCLVTATVGLAIGEKIQRGIGQGQQAFFQYQVPDEGFTIQVTVGMGQIAICGSTTIEQPSCSDPSLRDWRREVTGFVNVFITPDGLDAHSLPAGHPPPTAVPSNLQLFVALEGLDMNNNVTCLNSTLGDTRIPQGTKSAAVSLLALQVYYVQCVNFIPGYIASFPNVFT